jgi:hypothetical protein
MRRKPIARWLRASVAVATWAATVALVEASAESEIGHSARQLEERIELQLRTMDRGRAIAPQPDQPREPPTRSHEEPIEPWELVGV